MPLGDEPKLQSRKRKRAIEPAPAADPQPQLQAKRRKRSRRPRSWTPPEFWDNLSRVPLCRRALREFDRRTVQPVAPNLKPPERSVLKGDLVKQLKRFARHGGPNLRDIRGYPEAETEADRKMSSSQSRSRRPRKGTGSDPSRASSQTGPTTISSKDPAFEQALIDVGIYPEGYDEIEPENMEEIMERLGQPRPSLSPSSFPREKFLDFKRVNREARTKDVVRSDVFPIIRGRTVIPSGHNEKFNHLKPLASNISDAQPDYYNGSRPAQLHPDVRSDLGPYIIPCTDTSRPLLPNFFTELKEPKGDTAEMKLQIVQDLGNGARAMHEMQSYRQDEPVYDGNAYTLGWTYHPQPGVLTMYGMHPTQAADPGGQPQYHTTQLNSFAMTGNRDTCAEGMKWFRNSRDLAKEYRDTAIARANALADMEEASSPAEPYLTSFTASSQNELSITSNTTHQDSESSTDELARDTGLLRKRSAKPRRSGRRKRPNASSSA